MRCRIAPFTPFRAGILLSYQNESCDSAQEIQKESDGKIFLKNGRFFLNRRKPETTEISCDAHGSGRLVPYGRVSYQIRETQQVCNAVFVYWHFFPMWKNFVVKY